MHRLILIAFLFSSGILSDSEYPSGLVWLENPTCGGVLIEPDAIIVVKTCLGPNLEVAWPYRSNIRYSVLLPRSDLAILFLEDRLPNPVQLMSPEEFTHLVANNKFVRLANLQTSVTNWIGTIEDGKFSLDFPTGSFWLGVPVMTHPDVGPSYLLGIVKEDHSVLRLDPYYQLILGELKQACEENRRISCVKQEPPRQATPILVSTPPVPPTPPEVPTPTPVTRPNDVNGAPTPPTMKPPESLGCSCSQVRL